MRDAARTETSGRRRHHGLEIMAWTAVVAIGAAVVVLQALSDRWWPAIIVLFGPRWVFTPLLLATAPLLVRNWKRGLMPATIGLGLLLFGLLDVRVGAGRLVAPNGYSLRVAEYNIGGSRVRPGTLERWLQGVQPDIAILVECAPATGQSVATSLDWHVEATGSLCLLSPHPIRNWQPRGQMEFWRRSGSGAIARASVALPGGAVRVGVVHLATPRHALDTFGDLSELPTRGPVVQANRVLRDDESRAARAWIGGPTDVEVIGGDFNLPIESAVYRRHWGDFSNAFSRAGIGAGRTKRTRFFGVRIDHILVGSRVGVLRSWIGPDLGSDHRPVIADVTYR